MDFSHAEIVLILTALNQTSTVLTVNAETGEQTVDQPRLDLINKLNAELEKETESSKVDTEAQAETT